MKRLSVNLHLYHVHVTKLMVRKVELVVYTIECLQVGAYLLVASTRVELCSARLQKHTINAEL